MVIYGIKTNIQLEKWQIEDKKGSHASSFVIFMCTEQNNSSYIKLRIEDKLCSWNLVEIKMPRDKEDESKQALLGNEQQHKKGLDLRVKPKRNVIVEPLLFLFFLSGMPVTDLKSQYMYNRIAEDMGVNLTSKKHS